MGTHRRLRGGTYENGKGSLGDGKLTALTDLQGGETELLLQRKIGHLSK